METENFTLHEHEQYTHLVEEKFQRLQDEGKRLSKRIEGLEKVQDQLSEMNANMKLMLAEQESLRKEQSEMNERIKKQEEKDSQKWSKMWGYLIPAGLSFLAGVLTRFF